MERKDLRLGCRRRCRNTVFYLNFTLFMHFVCFFFPHLRGRGADGNKVYMDNILASYVFLCFILGGYVLDGNALPAVNTIRCLRCGKDVLEIRRSTKTAKIRMTIIDHENEHHQPVIN